MTRTYLALTAVVGLVALAGSSARADMVTYGFERITSNASVDIAGQLSVDVTNEGLDDGQVAFIFRNTGATASEISELYFDDGTLFGISQVVNSDVDPVTFQLGLRLAPGDLPGGEYMIPPFETTAGFGVDSDVRGGGDGVSNPQEWVKIIFDLQYKTESDFFSFDDVIAAINLGFTNPWAADSLRIGIHVRGIDGNDSDSDSFVAVPLPAGMLLGVLGLGAAGLKLRKFV